MGFGGSGKAPQTPQALMEMERGEKSRAERDRLTAEKMRTTEACKFTEKATKSWRRWKHGCGHLQEGGAVWQG